MPVENSCISSKQRLIRFFKVILGVCTLISLFVYPNTLYREDFVANAQDVEVSTTTNAYARQRAMDEFGYDPEIVKIINCESRFRQYDSKGNVLIGITGDVGIMQIAPQYWLDDARKRGIDIYTVDGNIAEAKIVLGKQSKRAWACYQKIAG